MKKMNSLNDIFNTINKFLTLSFKVGIFLGGMVLIFYCSRIGYFPKDVSVGDGLLFIFLAVVFGGLYLFFVVSLTGFGIVVISILYCGLKKFLLLKICKKLTKKLTKKNIHHIHFILKFYEITNKNIDSFCSFIINFLAERLPFAIIGSFLIISFSGHCMLILCALLEAHMWILYQKRSGNIIMLENKKIQQPMTLRNLKIYIAIN